MKLLGILCPNGSLIEYNKELLKLKRVAIEVPKKIYDKDFDSEEEAKEYLLDLGNIFIYPDKIEHKFIVGNTIVPLTSEQLQFISNNIKNITNDIQLQSIDNLLRSDKDYNELVNMLGSKKIKGKEERNEPIDKILNRFLQRAKHMIKRYEKRIDEYNKEKDNLSQYGHWSLGYFEGRKSVLEETIDDIYYDLLGENNE